jgi:hypothetical protein
MAEEGGLGKDLGIHERRPGLERDGCQFHGSMKLARRVDVDQRHREDQPAR